MARSVLLSRDEAEMLVDLCEATQDKRLWWLAQTLREQWGMVKQEMKGDRPIVPDLRYLGILASGAGDVRKEANG